MGQIVGRGGAVAEYDDGLGDVRVCQQEHVEVVLSVGHWYLKIHLLERRRDGEGLGVDLADEDGRLAGRPRQVLERANLGGDGSGEEEGLPLRGWGKHR